MGSNLAKTPLMAIVYASIMHFVLVFMPFENTYAETMHAFSTPLTGYLCTVGYGLLISIIIAILFASMEQFSILKAIVTTITLIGLQWIVPALGQLWYGDPSGVMSKMDLVWLTLSRIVCTVLLVTLAMLLLNKKSPGEAKPAEKKEKTYKLGKLSFAIKLLILPLVFCLLFFICWYFLAWRHEAVRLYYGSAAENRGFVDAFINLLLDDPGVLIYAPLVGLLHSVFLIPLMTRLPEKRIVFIISVALLNISPALLLLIPTPLIPDNVRMQILIQNVALFVAYGVFSSWLLHLSYKKQDLPEKNKLENDRSVGVAKDSKGPTPKQQAAALRTTMSGR